MSSDCLYQPTKPKRSKSAPPSRGFQEYGDVERKPQDYQIQSCGRSQRGSYPKKRTRKGSKPCGGAETIKVAVDYIGPLVYAVENGL